jgi:hypothetical protein
MIAVTRVRRMRRTGDHGWSPRACAEQGLRSAMTHIEQISAIDTLRIVGTMCVKRSQKYADVGVRRTRRTGGHGRPPRACAEQGLRSAMPQ